MRSVGCFDRSRLASSGGERSWGRRHRWLVLVVVAVIATAFAATPSPRVPTLAEVRASYRPSDRALLDRHGEVIQEIRIDRTIRRLGWTPLAEMSPALVDAVLDSEDRRFAKHHGVDARAVAGAVVARLRGEPLRGASTISMQLVSLLGSREGHRKGRRTFREKLRQMRIARALEASWTKNEILEGYLNLVSFRGELQGIAAASRALFDKAPHGVDGAEAAVLASLLRSPNAAPEQVLRRARASRSAATPGAIEAAVARLSESAGVSRVALAPHVADRLRRDLEGVDALRTTLDARMQRLATETLRAQMLALRDRRASDGAVLVADNASGEVLAYVGSSAELSSARHVDGVQAPRQAGSALKPFLYAAAFDDHLLTPASLLEDTPLEVPNANGVYRPENYDHEFRGLVSVRTALAGSLNVPAVRAALVLGVDRFAAALRELGFRRVIENGDYYGPALALGSVEVTLWEMVDAYRTLANGGAWRPLSLLPQAGTRESRIVYSPAAAFLVSSLLADRASRATTFGLENSLATPFWSAVKTGTSKDMRDNWCVGFTRRYTVGVWVGNFSGEPMKDVTGISGAAPAWLEIVSALEAESPAAAPPSAQGVVEASVTFPHAVEPPRREWFVTGTEPENAPPRELAERPRILSPASGSIIARDPDIPRDRQRMVFDAANAKHELAWRLDGHELGPASRPSFWDPQAGRHELALVDSAGRALDRVEFVVRPSDEIKRR